MSEKIAIILSDEEKEIYESMGADPLIVIMSVHRQILEVLRKAESLYQGELDYTEENIAAAILEAGITLTKERGERLKKRNKRDERLQKQLEEEKKIAKKPCPKRKK